MIATRKGNTAVKKGDKLAGMRVIPLIIEGGNTASRRAGRAPAPVGAAALCEENRRYRGHRQRGEEGPHSGHLHPGGAGEAGGLRHRDDLRGLLRRRRGKRGQRHRPKMPENRRGCHPLHRGHERGPGRQHPGGIQAEGARIVTYGAPVLPGAMFLLGYFEDGTALMGLPGCVMYAGATIFDLALPGSPQAWN